MSSYPPPQSPPRLRLPPRDATSPMGPYAEVAQCKGDLAVTTATIHHLESELSRCRARLHKQRLLLHVAINAPVPGGRDVTEQVPDEVLVVIIKFLQIEDIYRGAVLVSKRWHCLVSSIHLHDPSTNVDIRLAKYRSGHLQPYTLLPHSLGAGETTHWLRTCIAASPNGVCSSTTNKSSGQDGCYPLRSGSLSMWSDTAVDAGSGKTPPPARTHIADRAATGPGTGLGNAYEYLQCDSEGNVYLLGGGVNEMITVWSPTGQLLRTIAVALQHGQYNLNRPGGLFISSSDQLFVGLGAGVVTMRDLRSQAAGVITFVNADDSDWYIVDCLHATSGMLFVGSGTSNAEQDNSTGGAIRIFFTDNPGDVVVELPGSDGDSIRCLATSNDDEVLYSGSNGGVRIWDISADGWNVSGDYESEVSPPKRILTIPMRGPATALAVDADDRLYIGSSSGKVSVWSRHSFSITHELKISGDLNPPWIYDIVIGPNCRVYACYETSRLTNGISVW